jgi:DNA-binding SARP family transcriptional activator
MAPTQLSLLDGFELRHAGRAVTLGLASQRLLAYLALHERPLQRIAVAGALWLDSNEQRSRANLRSALWRLQAAGLRLIDASSSHLALASWVLVDVRVAVTTARDVLAGRVETCLKTGHTELLQAELLPDWYEDWVVLERERLRLLRLHALEAAAAQLLALGRHSEAIETCLAAVHAEPLRESAQVLLLRACLAEGNRAEALRQYRRYEQQLAAELGIAPAPATARLVGIEVGDDGVTHVAHTGRGDAPTAVRRAPDAPVDRARPQR